MGVGGKDKSHTTIRNYSEKTERDERKLKDYSKMAERPNKNLKYFSEEHQSTTFKYLGRSKTALLTAAFNIIEHI